MVTKDMTGGYGPLVYQIRAAPRGTYKILVKLVSSKGRTVARGVTAFVYIYTQYGTQKQKETIELTRLKEDKEIAEIGDVLLS